MRGLSMIAIIAFHTEVYYKETDVTPYYLYTTNAIILFYFISGYLFYRERPLCLKRKISGIIRTMLVPYFIFTVLLTIPKYLIRNESMDWQEIALHILSGRASWFIVSLIVAETVFSVLLVVSKGSLRWLSAVAVVCFTGYFLVHFNVHNFWQWQDALLTVSFLYAGYVYHRYEDAVNRFHRPLYSLFFFLILILVKIYEYRLDLPVRNIAIECAPLFLLDACFTLLAVIGVIRLIPHSRLIEWTGQHCIVYYFLCGGCPMIVARLLSLAGMPYSGMLYQYLIALVLAYALDTVLTWAIYRFVPFLVKV